ncbi:MAG: ATP-dependent DNA helicase RecG [Candidatus Marinimicrobia bacterium]|nr:ATP-dependent DNA helicase RecG [Candidatus Neomarinimicrobiota bacterium]MBT3501816.1 ATP-dependent DNA helicase RecG [Candidatus Neomarinimicrobiota bacterium]MBT3840138.1 ATP-dependent DNA helicase RecG [Candidatus Neomarinimicrobiota bacterium]MBT4000031.1 ATP-dependent DNA helicase RecG [Candidatus Neomarinimicrobiota bacterium]MBT4282346.1 ATP-dependent DNA helicase RecG [Candidatus Neomarinimicrobiota bacterium]
MNFTSPISTLNGVGSRREKVLNDQGISTLGDLLYYFPRRHLDRTTISPIRNFTKGDVVTLMGTVESFGEKSTRRGKIFQVIVSDGTGLLTLTWFNGVRYLKPLFKIGDKLAIHGKVDYYGGFTITHPEFDTLEKDDDPVSTGKVIPLYPLTQELKSDGIDQRILRNMVKDVLQSRLDIPEIFPHAILDSTNYITLSEALSKIHFSNGIGELTLAIQRLKFDEHFFLQLLMALRKRSLQHSGAVPLLDIGPYFKLISESLNFELTGAQKKVIKEIHDDLKNSTSMNRLLQGDVGSGKTIVSILVSALAVGNNVQVAIMAPTEILATQHFHSFKTELDKANIPCALLVGKMKKSERAPILEGIENGKIPVLIGTHALIQDDIIFNNLGLVIVDEQHRFGVNQRAKLLDKGNHPHFLAMTATPIPRTLSITYHGDMELSIIDEMPANRIPVVSKVVEPTRLPKVYQFMKEEVAVGRQCMIIYPLVEESEKSDLSAAVEAHQQLDEIIFPDISVGLIHGRMTSDEKDEIMARFSKNEISILVSTTVIEVGVDIPNATVMMIEHAERFGLTQLHQLRGRVGRGVEKSYCIMVKRDVTDPSRKRLSIMEKTNDGFIIADEDLKLRGPGEFFGLKQSGFFQFKIANMVTDGVIIRDARKVAFELIEQDPNLKKESNQVIREIFLRDYADRLENISLS